MTMRGAAAMCCEKVFRSIYRRECQGHTFCPYRVCLIGAHTDHQHGKVTGLAIDKGIRIAYGPRQDGMVELASVNFDKRAQFHVNGVPEKRVMDWADYLRGATAALGKRYPLHHGMRGVIEGSLPIGGLSSSAAIIIAYLSALARINGVALLPAELIDIALHAENDYVGVSCGKLDQSCEVYGKNGHLLYLDTKDDSYELIPTHPKMKPHKIAVFFSGIERTLVGSKFNMRVDELKSAAYAIKGFAVADGLEDELAVPYGRYEDARLRDVPRRLYDRYKARLPGMWQKRADHFYTESERVEKGAEAWRNGDMDTFGRLSFQSGQSSIENYETGSPQTQTLFEIMLRTDGIYGGRFSGGGFQGCCAAFVDPLFEDTIREKVTREYTKIFPRLKDTFSVHFCHSADGVCI